MAQGIKILAKNKKAWHEYIIEDTYEAGIALKGTEVKSIRLGKVNFVDSFVLVRDGQCRLYGMHVSPYEQGNIHNGEPTRTRTLLLHKRQIFKIHDKAALKGFAIVPLKIYLKNGLVKIEIGIAKGKKLHDKRHTDKERDVKRKIDKALKQY